MHRRMSSRRRTSSFNFLTGSGKYGGDTTSSQVHKLLVEVLDPLKTTSEMVYA